MLAESAIAEKIRRLNGSDCCWEECSLRRASGSAVISSDESKLFVDNLSNNSFDFYRFPAASLENSIASHSTNLIVKGVAFAEGGRVAVCGSDRHFTQIVDLATHKVQQRLSSENPSDVLQVNATRSLGDRRHLIASGGSSSQKSMKPMIYVWEKVDFQCEDRPASNAPNLNATASARSASATASETKHFKPDALLFENKGSTSSSHEISNAIKSFLDTHGLNDVSEGVARAVLPSIEARTASPGGAAFIPTIDIAAPLPVDSSTASST
ncbi:hypothetical protein H0H92_003719 [Tricholoma furcatifolium]|nr:hypothetical protein H0H92_003719 [Tricholoma furcatifolium]